MKILVFLTLLVVGLHSAAAVTHSLKYFYTGSSQVPNFPEYVSVGMVDEAQISYCDSNTKRSEPKQDWMSRVMYGCEWDDETGEVNGFIQFGYDGEDFIVLDLKTETWIAPKPQSVITKHKWDHNRAQTVQFKHYLTQECPDWIKKYVNYGKSSLMRT
eukprot:superscaffoldBa00011674_g25322